MNESKSLIPNNYAIILFFDSNESLLSKIKFPLTYEGKNQLFQEILLKNSLRLSSECDSYRNFIRMISLELEEAMMICCENIGTKSSKGNEFFLKTEELISPYQKLSNYLIFLNNLFLLDENAMDFLDSNKLGSLILDLLARFFQHYINEKDLVEANYEQPMKDLALKLFENLNILIRKNNYSGIETFIDQSFLERLVFLIDFTLIEEMVLRTIFSLATGCFSNVWLIEFVQKKQILKLLPNKIQDKNLDFILMAIEMFYMFPIIKSNEEDLNLILGALKRRLVGEFNNPMINLKELIQQIYKYCYREYKNVEEKKALGEKSPNKKNKKKAEESKIETPKKNTVIENASFVEVKKNMNFL